MFDDHNVMGEEVSIRNDAVKTIQFLIPTWWSASFLQFMRELERRVQISVLAKKKKGPTRTLRQFVAPPNSTIETANVPKELPEDCYHKANFLDCLLPVQLKAWKLQPPIMPEDVKDLFIPSGCSRKKKSPSSDVGSGPNFRNACPTTSKPNNEEESEFPARMFENEEDEAMGDGEDE
ncbi:hypothetical protein DFH28DRAFT_1182455 [Melampsora americana]|nr:hypothetical protein DFH28DRAFT_1182455 [Melampsora americana]